MRYLTGYLTSALLCGIARERVPSCTPTRGHYLRGYPTGAAVCSPPHGVSHDFPRPRGRYAVRGVLDALA